MKAASLIIHVFFCITFRSDWLNLFHPTVFLLSHHWCCIGLLGQKTCHLDDSGMCLMLISIIPSQCTVEGTAVLWLAQRIGKLNVLDLLVVDCFLPGHLATLPNVSAELPRSRIVHKRHQNTYLFLGFSKIPFPYVWESDFRCLVCKCLT